MNSKSITSNIYALKIKIDKKVCHKYDTIVLKVDVKKFMNIKSSRR